LSKRLGWQFSEAAANCVKSDFKVE
jgi:hypothetical protein